ncbi:hypothetical protein SAICODRAFT_21970 [Saitoella complicata NRRL Y-17804]|uniref:uncharacterized protein n=1 Tax=Saitoella complicata (strain BCRC 22490 / CBS 7301 / JCM 7358 / NBRC 10748 / NRRL Y-17804) TaxID=698492 RepID=UPI000866EE7B|nr:uncharacterized protein SAICODRAFT_21970 [Saitoella complicata NRRL Y-17804]ODQ49989.1 hypothetical protein SAICODRAFT_21970 [Saitoella complicata NRRL Y-17804]
MDRQQSLLGAGGLQFFSLCASFIPWYAIDRGGRRRLIMSTLAGMGVCLAVSGALVRYGGKANGIGATDMLYLFGVYLAEPLPLRLRGTGNALAVCSQWLQRSSLSRSRLQPSLTSATGQTAGQNLEEIDSFCTETNLRGAVVKSLQNKKTHNRTLMESIKEDRHMDDGDKNQDIVMVEYV